MKLFGILPMNAGGIGLVQIYERENPKNVQIRRNLNLEQLDCDRIVFLGSLSGEDTYHTLAEISRNGAKALPESSDHMSLNVNGFKLQTTRQAA